uniref:Uncharacterized protein n=1 Tax=Timema tahoe TaxID=61484 RepID=A0A7R9NX50_9NEOP|nr:unnamed protein product [Timema tahoe]
MLAADDRLPLMKGTTLLLQEHLNFIGQDESLGPVCLSVKTENVASQEHMRILLRLKTGTMHELVPSSCLVPSPSPHRMAKVTVLPTIALGYTHSLPDVQDTHSLPNVQDTHSLPNVQDTHSLPNVQDTHSLPNVQDTHPLPNVQDTHPLPNVQDTHPLPNVQDSHPLPNVQDTHPLPNVQDSHSPPNTFSRINIYTISKETTDFHFGVSSVAAPGNVEA